MVTKSCLGRLFDLAVLRFLFMCFGTCGEVLSLCWLFSQTSAVRSHVHTFTLTLWRAMAVCRYSVMFARDSAASLDSYSHDYGQ